MSTARPAANIIVAGAGPAGLTIARILALRGWTVTVIEPAGPSTDRLEMISPVALPTLDALGLSHALRDPMIAKPCRGIQRRWGRSPIAFDEFLLHPGGAGFVIDRAKFDQHLRGLTVEAGAEFIAGRVTSVFSANDEISLTIETDAGTVKIATNTAIDASGRRSVLGRRLGSRRLVTEPLVANRLRCSFGHKTGTGTGTGSFYAESIGASWRFEISGPNDREEEWFVSRGGDRTKRIPGYKTNASSAMLHPGGGRGWLAIGDASAAFDPITSQGLANALASARVAAGSILASGAVTEETASFYSDAIASTFMNAEAGRIEVYKAI